MEKKGSYRMMFKLKAISAGGDCKGHGDETRGSGNLNKDGRPDVDVDTKADKKLEIMSERSDAQRHPYRPLSQELGRIANQVRAEGDTLHGPIKGPPLLDHGNVPIPIVIKTLPPYFNFRTCHFLMLISVLGFFWCYLVMWPFLIALLVNEEGLDLVLRNEMVTSLIPYSSTRHLALFHSSWLNWFRKIGLSSWIPIVNYVTPSIIWTAISNTFFWIHENFICIINYFWK